MQRIFTLAVACCLCLFVGNLNAQPYLTSTYSDISVETNITYGANYTVLTLPVTGSTTLRPLQMDLYTPNDNTDDQRPLVILFGTGNFLPQGVNGGVYGTRMDSVNVETAMRLAQLGYVVAVADYRLGWDPLSTSQDVRISTLIGAAYRGQQDARSAIRFFKKSVVEGNNPYGICADRISLWGIGTGGYVSLATGYLDEYSDVLVEKFIGPDINGDGNPDPYVIPSLNSDVEGSTLTTNPLNGDTLNTPAFSNFSDTDAYDSEVQLVVNVAGAVGDSSWIDENDPPLIAFHVPSDPNAPYMTSTLIIPTTGEFVVEVSGSYDAVRIANEKGINDALGEDMIDDVWTDAANEDNDGYDGLFPLTDNIFTNALGMQAAQSDPYNWWDGPFWMNVPYTDDNDNCRIPIPMEFCNFDFVTKLSHEVNDAGESRTVIDSMINYFAPRAFNVHDLGSGCSFMSSTDNLPAEVAQLTATPNPADEAVIISTGSDMPMRSVAIFSVEGKVVSFQNNLSAKQFTFNRRNLPAGMYYVQVRFDAGTATQRVVFK